MLKSSFAEEGNLSPNPLSGGGQPLLYGAAGSRESTIVLAVNTLLMTLFTIFSYFMDGFAYAAEALSGKYYGAKHGGIPRGG